MSLELTEVWRQADPTFISLLQAVRVGRYSWSSEGTPGRILVWHKGSTGLREGKTWWSGGGSLGTRRLRVVKNFLAPKMSLGSSLPQVWVSVTQHRATSSRLYGGRRMGRRTHRKELRTVSTPSSKM